MLYIDKLTLHNFKSFKDVTLKFNNGFNCIVGPNGSGKSNICDSLLFALGENSLKRIRAGSTAQLVSNIKGTKAGPKKAYVKVHFSGESDIVLTRVIKENGKVSYRLNGTRMKKQEVVDFLSAQNCMISEANTITQGEIIKILNFTAKERRGLIDIASGIKEFDDKKSASLKELAKVEEKITSAKVALNERKGFLEELKKEKEAAERYIELSNMIKRISYTVLKLRYDNLEKKLMEDISRRNDLTASSKSYRSELDSLDLENEKLMNERNAKSKALNEHSTKTASINKALEELNRDIAIAQASYTNLEGDSKRISAEMENLKNELLGAKETIGKNNSQISEVEAEISSLEKVVEGFEQNPSGNDEELYKRYEKCVNDIAALSENLSSLEKEKASINIALEHESVAKTAADATIESVSKKVKEIESIIKENEEGQKSAERMLRDANSEIEMLVAKKRGLEAELDVLQENKINLKENIALHGGNFEKVNSLLKQSVKSGFYGMVFELCSFEPRYANAVNAAAMGRMNYFVVDSVETAEQCIGILKSRGLGRASFIPLDSIRVSNQKMDGQKSSRWPPLLKFIQYDDKFEKAIKFVFSNTMLVDSVSDAKNEIGSYRFVTLDGELVEQSGVVSGGTIKTFQYNKSQLELKTVEKREQELREEVSGLQASEEKSRKALGRIETQLIELRIEKEKAESEMKSALLERGNSEKALGSCRERISELAKNAENTDRSIEDLQARLVQLKNESAMLYKQISRFAQQGGGISKEYKQKVKDESAKLEKLRIRRAELLKENEMLNSKISELEKRNSEYEASMKGHSEEMRAIKARLKALETDKNAIEEKIKTSDKQTSEAYQAIVVIDKSISDISSRRGVLSGKLEGIERELIGIDAEKAQVETRLSDIKAEMSSYADVEPLDGILEELEAKLGPLKNEIDRMGNVNMRAPDMYRDKAKDVEEAFEKLGTLEKERESILSMIKQIESKKLDVFYETFNAVNENFKEPHRSVFNDEAELMLEDRKDPFNSGLEFNLKSWAAKVNRQALSGGENSLLILMLVFAIQICKPMSFYIFDEIDAALDKENSKKLSALIKQMSSRSQFIVVSHNDALISHADTAIGVAKANGESKVFGVEVVGNRSSMPIK
ncbi:chromosome segregation protein SMC [Candidatus Marsarchaeota archaeon]|nr:chromosome segregation protein SMC [Candidatus Marsarchaeota archaeon]